MSRRIIISFVVLVMVSGAAFAATGTDDVVLTVIPGGVGVTITATPNSYDFETVNLSKSSNSATEVVISNSGTVGATMDKKVQAITSAGTAWTLAVATGTQDNCVLWCFSQESRPSLINFGTATSYDTSIASFSSLNGQTSTYDTLRSAGGSQVTLATGKGATTWYRIDIPNSVSKSDAQSITVRFRGTSE